MRIPSTTPALKIFIVAISVLVGAGVVAYNITDDDTLAEQLQNLLEIEPYELEGLRLDTWDLNGSTLHATYDGKGRSNWFSLTVLPTEDQARSWFVDAHAALSDEEEVQQINTFVDIEYCASVGGATRCIGWDGNRTFEGFTSGVGYFGRELDALGLIRTARKHWYRIYSRPVSSLLPRPWNGSSTAFRSTA